MKRRNRWNIWTEMNRMQDEMDHLFGKFFGEDFFGRMSDRRLLQSGDQRSLVQRDHRQPLADMWENDKEIVINAEIPGVDKKDINVTATEDGINLEAESKSEIKEEDKDKGVYRHERSYSGFQRFFSLPEEADIDNIKTSYQKGVLELRIPKKEESKKKKVEVKIE
jgi:HSP20 family protein